MNKVKNILAVLMAVSTAALAGANWNDPALTPVKITVNKNSVPVTLFAGAESRCVIVIPAAGEDKACKSLTHVQSFPLKKAEYQNGVACFAALELQKLLKAVSGANVQIITSGTALPEGKTPIFVGMSSAAKKYGFDNSSVKPGGFKIEVKNKALAILNAPYPVKPAAQWDGLYTVVYAVYDFAERFLNCRFYYPGPDGTITPRMAKLELPGLVYSDAPEVSMRILFSWYTTQIPGYPEMDPLKMALRYRAGGSGEFSVAPPPHLTDPVRRGMKPAVDAQGKVIKTSPVMPCFGDPQAAKVFLKLFKPQEQVISILPPDHPIKCQCKYCKDNYDMSVPYHGRASGLYGKFIQNAAQELKKTAPEKKLYFTAYYNYTAPSHGLTLPDNTMVQLCLMYGQNTYHDPYINKITGTWIDRWNKITGKPVFVYVYPNWPGVGYCPLPKQYYHNLKKFFLENRGKIAGLFSDGPNTSGIQAIRGGFYAHSLPTTYCEFKLLWNPEFDVDAAVADMCKRMYGKGSDHMHKIISGIAGLWESPATTGHKSMYVLGDYAAGSISRETIYKKIIKKDFVEHLKNELDKAYAAVKKDSAEYRRIDFFGQTLKLFFTDYKNFHNPLDFTQKRTPVQEVPYVADLNDKAHMPEWANIPKHEFVNAYLSHGDQPGGKTTVQFAYDRHGVIYKFILDEPAMNNIRNAPRSNIWGGDCIEVHTEYVPGSVYHLTVNSEQAMRDRFIGKYPAKRSNMPYRYIKKYDDHWVFMLYLPFSTLDATRKFDPKNPIRFNATRSRVQKNGERHVSRWNTTFSRDHADISAFGTLLFEPMKPRSAKVVHVPYVADLKSKAHMPEWANIPKQIFVNARAGNGASTAAKLQTSVQTAYDKYGIIYKFFLEEPAMNNVVITSRNQIWSGDYIQVSTEYAPGSIYQLTVNMEKVMFDRFIGKNPAKRSNMPYRYIEKHEKHWIFMLYLPFATLDGTRKFDPSLPIRFNALRVRKQKNGSSSASIWYQGGGNSGAMGTLNFEPAAK
ncbi:MAG: DUF4838 domain-containing protein [Lentisphaerae bacterium]|nr:DUF4838 domain-containing protein [Lentisphaerota bacterium]